MNKNKLRVIENLVLQLCSFLKLSIDYKNIQTYNYLYLHTIRMAQQLVQGKLKKQ